MGMIQFQRLFDLLEKLQKTSSITHNMHCTSELLGLLQSTHDIYRSVASCTTALHESFNSESQASVVDCAHRYIYAASLYLTKLRFPGA